MVTVRNGTMSAEVRQHMEFRKCRDDADRHFAQEHQQIMIRR